MAQCRATAKGTGQQCRRAAIRGGGVCPVHGGRAPQVVAAAERRLAVEHAQVQVTRLHLADVDPDPHAALADELRRCVAVVEAVMLLAAELPAAQFLKLWGEERDRLTKVALVVASLPEPAPSKTIEAEELDIEAQRRHVIEVLRDMNERLRADWQAEAGQLLPPD